MRDGEGWALSACPLQGPGHSRDTPVPTHPPTSLQGRLVADLFLRELHGLHPRAGPQWLCFLSFYSTQYSLLLIPRYQVAFQGMPPFSLRFGSFQTRTAAESLLR